MNDLKLALDGGISAVIRPIHPDDGPRLTEGLRQLSPESRRKRFLFSKGGFSPGELDYFTHCDGVKHLALVVVETNQHGEEKEFIAVARCIRDSTDTTLAEVAIAVADDWQHHGVGEWLIQALAKSAWDAGIRYWNAYLFSNNIPMRKLLELVGRKTEEQDEDTTVVRLVYKLFPTTREHTTKKHAES